MNLTTAAEYPGALWIPSSHYWQGRNNQELKWIILHGTDGFSTAQEVAAFFQTNDPPTSSHYIIGKDGTVVQCVSESDSAWANGAVTPGHAPWWDPNLNPNYLTVSIEHVKSAGNQNADVLTPAQQAASFALVSYLCKKWGIPARQADANGGITGHFSMDPQNRSYCPGTYDWVALWNSLASNEVLCAYPWHRESEFDIVLGGVRKMGACGMAALAAAATSATGKVWHPIDVYLVASAHGWCDESGAITPLNLKNTAMAMGFKVAAFRDYAEPWPDWLSWCETQIDAGNPIVVETAVGQALVDLLTGSGENAQNLQYHFLEIEGRNRGGPSSRVNYTLPAGWWAADGDNFAGGNNFANNFNAADQPQYYEDYRVANAQLCAGIALVGRQTQAMVWTDAPGGRGVDAHGHSCGSGDYTAIKANGLVGVDGLANETYPNSAVQRSVLPLADGTLILYDPAHGVTLSRGSVDAGPVVADLITELAAAQKAAALPVAPALPTGPVVIPDRYLKADAAITAISAAIAVQLPNTTGMTVQTVMLPVDLPTTN